MRINKYIRTHTHTNTCKETRCSFYISRTVLTLTSVQKGNAWTRAHIPVTDWLGSFIIIERIFTWTIGLCSPARSRKGDNWSRKEFPTAIFVDPTQFVQSFARRKGFICVECMFIFLHRILLAFSALPPSQSRSRSGQPCSCWFARFLKSWSDPSYRSSDLTISFCPAPGEINC